MQNIAEHILFRIITCNCIYNCTSHKHSLEGDSLGRSSVSMVDSVVSSCLDLASPCWALERGSSTKAAPVLHRGEKQTEQLVNVNVIDSFSLSQAVPSEVHASCAFLTARPAEQIACQKSGLAKALYVQGLASCCELKDVVPTCRAAQPAHIATQHLVLCAAWIS